MPIGQSVFRMGSPEGLNLETPGIVLDVGRYNIKLGFSNASKLKPDHVLKADHVLESIPSVNEYSSEISDCLTLTEQCFQCDLSSEIFEQLIDNCLQTEINEYPFMLIESPLTEHKCRVKKLEIFLEELGVSSFALSNEALMSLYAAGRHTGVVVYSGFSESYCCTIHEGFMAPHSVVTMHHNSGYSVAKLITTVLMNNTNGRKSHVNSKGKPTIAAAMRYMETSGKVNGQPHESPAVGTEVGELLFGQNGNAGIHSIVEKAIYQTDEMEDYNHFYYENLVLAGGNTLYTGLKERLKFELEQTKVDKNASVSVVSSPYPEYAAWIGGSILASLPTFKHRWITRQDYMEWGDNIFRLKCLRY